MYEKKHTGEQSASATSSNTVSVTGKPSLSFLEISEHFNLHDDTVCMALLGEFKGRVLSIDEYHGIIETQHEIEREFYTWLMAEKFTPSAVEPTVAGKTRAEWFTLKGEIELTLAEIDVLSAGYDALAEELHFVNRMLYKFDQ